ncbi:MAG: hypothetical protein KGV51_00995 [Moraxellaceae bacterium]|nr:hypothetical protein [Moraxellaceae bacterium]
MATTINGAGAGQLIPDDMIAQKIHKEIMTHGILCNLAPNIALADADFEGQLICGDKVKWFTGEHTNSGLLQSVQGNEEPETTQIKLCSESAEICGMKKFKIKVSNDQLRKLECEGLRDMYINHIENVIKNTVEQMWDDSHMSYLLMMANAENTGNNALGMGVNLGSPDNPIILSKTDRSRNADILEALFMDLHTVIGEQQGDCGDGDNALIMSNLVSSSALKVFSDLNTCCADNNVKITGNLPKTILGFDPFKSTRAVLRTNYKGRELHYLIVVDKKASGFVSDMYGFKWHEEAFDWYLVGTEVHGSYVLKPEHVAVAVVAFE